VNGVKRQWRQRRIADRVATDITALAQICTKIMSSPEYALFFTNLSTAVEIVSSG
jgi:hypothetical protein